MAALVETKDPHTQLSLGPRHKANASRQARGSEVHAEEARERD